MLKMTEKTLNKERLGKLVSMAKGGYGPEKETAIAMVKRLCEKHDLVFSEVMEDQHIETFVIECRKDQFDILLYCVARYGLPSCDKYPWPLNRRHTGICFDSTKEMYIETLNAFSVLSRLFKKEKEKTNAALLLAFRSKHKLYYTPKNDEDERLFNEKVNKSKKKKTAKELETERLAANMVDSLERADIHKQLK